ncbi:UNVERIFIED_CONTAM: Embryogenesis-associated protein [Sesamum radiatum]|uniref:Embryogenesis-associated protein n=1 Tax=Sesamum radiatum TaxID=300843 RepID=A0AAW2PX93_SESRA
MDCSEAILETPAVAYEFLFKSALAIPLSHYLVGLLLLCLVLLYNYLEFHFFQDLFTGFRGGRVFLTYNPSSEIYHGVVSKCRTLHGRYLATPWLSSPHFQTSFVNFFGRPPVFTYRRQMFHASDGGTFALDWLMHSDVSEAAFQNNHAMSKDDATPIVVMVPGLTSDSASPYMKHLVFYTAKQGWNVVVSNHRGLGGVSVTTDCFYNAGWTEDVREVITYLHKEYSAAPLFVVGTSIGANILVKYLGEEGECSNCRCCSSLLSLGSLGQFIRISRVRIKVYELFSSVIIRPSDTTLIGRVHMIYCAYSDKFTEHIGSRFICRRLIQKLYDRALTIGLQDMKPVILDLLTGMVLKSHALFEILIPMPHVLSGTMRANKNVVLATTQHGGHLAFFEGITGSGLWWVRAVNEFLAALLASPFMHTQKKAESLAPHSALTQSSIDQGPYLNVADGMVAAMGNERTDGAINETAEENKDHGQIASGTENHPFTSGRKSNSATDASQSSEDGVDSKGSGIVARCLYQLSRQNNKSVWLLAYIAIVSTWPLVGAALGFFFGRKLKRALPGKPPK